MAYRKAGPLKQLTQVSFPRRLLFFDTETYVNEIMPDLYEFPFQLGVAVYVELARDGEVRVRRVYNFTAPEEFITILTNCLSKRSTLYVFAHHTAFDVQVLDLPGRFAALGWANEPPIINDRVFIWSIKTPTGPIKFLDTANLGVMSVEQLGKDVGLEKLNVDFDTVAEADLAVYCQRDVEILERFVVEYLRYLRDNDLGGFRLTIASQSLCTFRSRFLAHPPVIHNYEQATLLERDGYFGGRVECYWIGIPPGERFYYLDVNSMYPTAMASARLPLVLRGYSVNVPLYDLRVRLNRFYCIADVELDTDTPAYPYKPDWRLLFPVGQFRTVLHHPELTYAIEQGHIRNVHRCAVYDHAPVLRDYVEYFYCSKVKHTRQGNKSWRYIDKLFLNCLYGKFGQREPHRKMIGETENNGVWRLVLLGINGQGEFQEICWFGKIYREWREGETATSFPALAGAVTATARMILWGYIEAARRENVFYCDTDSLIVNQAGYERLQPYISPDGLGRLKVEEVSNRVVIHNCKDYQFGDTKKTKGVPKKATPLGEGKWRYMQFHGFTTWLNRGANGPPRGKMIVKQRVSYYAKGIVWPDGHVTPQPLGPWAD